MPLAQSLAQVPNKQRIVFVILKMAVTIMMVMLLMINLSFELYSRQFPLLETPPY